MRISSYRQNTPKLLLNVIIFMVALGAPGCDWGFLGCKNSTSTTSCGQYNSVHLDKTITASDPSFYLETPLASSSSDCPADYNLIFGFANLDTAIYYLNNLSAVPVNIATAFQVKATDGTGGYFVKDQDWHIEKRSQVFPQWLVSFSDHNSNSTLSSKYFITFGLNSLNPGDSVKVSGTIGYHVPN